MMAEHGKHGGAARRRPIVVGVAVAVLLTCLGVAAWIVRDIFPLPAIQTDRYLVGAHYYIWYPRNFSQGYLRGQLLPHQDPAVGEYRLDDPNVLERQIAWCSQYGIDFLTIDWWPGRKDEQRAFLGALYRTPNLADIRFCVFYETWGLGFDKNAGCTKFDAATTERLIADFTDIADQCFSHPSYLRLHGRPVVVLYLTRTFTGKYEKAISSLREAMRQRGHDLFIIGDEIFWKVSPSLPGVRPSPLAETAQWPRIRLFDAITSYNLYEGGTTSHVGYASQSRYVADVADLYEHYRRTVRRRVYLAPQIIPGYNDRGTRLVVDHYAIPRQWEYGAAEGSLFAELFERHAFRFLDPRLNLLFITSWNEWNEDTAVEPLAKASPTNRDRSPSGTAYTQGYDYSGHGASYLEVIRDKVVAVAGRVVDRNGNGQAGVTVSAHRRRAFTRQVTTDTSGFYRMSRLGMTAGSYEVCVTGAALSGRAVEVNATGCVSGVDFVLEPRIGKSPRSMPPW
jgi:hypothetical protein